VSRIREFLKLAGKRGHTISAVFGTSPARAPLRALLAPRRSGSSVWLFSTTAPDPDTAALCESVCVLEDPIALLVEAEKQLWPHWVGLTVATWTGERGAWPVKLAPFLIPPFRTLFMNEQEDYFSGSPGAVLSMSIAAFATTPSPAGIACWISIVVSGCGICAVRPELRSALALGVPQMAWPLATGVTALPGAGGEIAVFHIGADIGTGMSCCGWRRSRPLVTCYFK